jgi:hypothetical protein
VPWVEAIILELAEIENCPLAVWQPHHPRMVDRTPGPGYGGAKALGWVEQHRTHRQ